MFQTVMAPGVFLGANGQHGSMAIGNILMLLMKALNAQGGSAFSFPHEGHHSRSRRTLMDAFRPEPDTPVRRNAFVSV
jgi:hypothetical protein